MHALYSMRALYVATLAVVGLVESQRVGPINVQSHSFNDLRVLEQALAKAEASARAAADADGRPGAPLLLMLKLDPQWAPASVCTRFTRVPVGDQRGCLVFNHDSVTAAGARADFNSSGDLVELVSGDALSRYTRGAANVTLAVSLCFKGCGGSGCPCAGGAATDGWLSLVDDLKAALDTAALAHGLNSLTILLDGAGNPGAATCLAQRWRPWNSVFISGDDPAGAFTGGNASLGWDRLVVLNDDTGTFPVAAALGFGKFAGNGTDGNGSAPYIVWEPSDGPGVAAAVDQYVGSPGAPNPAGLRFAINIDAAQLDVYAAQTVAVLPAASPHPATGGWATVAAGGAGGTAPSLALLPQSLTPDGPLLVAAWVGAGGGALAFDARLAWGGGGGPTPAGSGNLPVASPPGASDAWSLSPLVLADGSSVLVYTLARRDSANASIVTEQVLHLALAAGSGTGGAPPAFHFTSAGPPAPPPAGAPPVTRTAAHAPFAAALCACGPGAAGGGAAPAAVADACRAWAWAPGDAASADGCLVRAALFGGPAASPFSLGAPAACVARAADPASPLLGALTARDVDAVSVSAAPYALGGSADPRVGLALAFSGGGFVLAAAACATDAASGAGVGVNDPACWTGGALGNASTTAPLLSHVGAAPRVSLAPLPPAPPLAGAGLLVLEVHTNGSCPNNEVDNKRADAALCDQPPVHGAAAPYAVYNYGRVGAWGAQLLRAEGLARAFNGSGPPPSPAALPAPWPGASPCDAAVAHGSWGQGGRPAGAVMPLPGGALAAAVALEAAAGAARDPLHCGAPPRAAAAGVALQGWRLAAAGFT